MKGGEILNIVANSVTEYSFQATEQDSLQAEDVSLFSSLLTNEVSSISKKTLLEDDLLPKLIQRVREELSSLDKKKIVKDDTRVILPITLMGHPRKHVSSFEDIKVASTSVEMISSGLTTASLDAIKIHFLQMIEQMLSQDAEVSDETRMNLENTSEIYEQKSEMSLMDTNDLSFIEHVLSNTGFTLAELGNIANSFESALQKIDGKTGGNYFLSSFTAGAIKAFNSSSIALDINDQGTPETNEPPAAFHSAREKNVEVSNDEIIQEFQRISKDAQQIIEDVLQNEETPIANKQLLQLLEQAKQIKQAVGENTVEDLIAGKEETKSMWMNLQTMYEKRSTFSKSGSYLDHAKVRSTDVGVWLEHLAQERQVSFSQAGGQLQQHMSTVEHFVLHTQTKSEEIVQQEQMMHHIKQIVQQSRIGKNYFFKQLSISIQPEHLGDMTIQLVKVDGEMIAKITVSSQATKNALDANLHQLKNMFAPHQVIIEKQEGNEQATFDPEDTREEQHKSSYENDKDQHAEDQHEQSFEEQFEKILADAVGES